jgi:hypothetical protein
LINSQATSTKPQATPKPTSDGFVNQHGDYIKKLGSNYFNVNTGVNFNFGDDDE